VICRGDLSNHLYCCAVGALECVDLQAVSQVGQAFEPDKPVRLESLTYRVRKPLLSAALSPKSGAKSLHSK
jgi:hypothetical protein